MITRGCVRPWAIGIACAVTATTVSASEPYRFGTGWRSQSEPRCAPAVTESSVQMETGRPHQLVDGAGWVLGIPGKLLLWDRRVNNHNVAPETAAAVATYLEQNQLQDVCVRVNQYAPGAEWRRLTENREVGAGWRYTIGTLSVVGYTIFPGRLVGGDRYNPYTNSLYVYSDIPSLAMQPAAYAKDVHAREYPGTYAAVNELPVITLWHETIATQDTLAYLETTAGRQEYIEALEVLHPYYGSRVGGSIDRVIGVGPLAQIAGAVVGHATGRWQAHHIPSESATAWVELSADQTIDLVQR